MAHFKKNFSYLLNLVLHNNISNLLDHYLVILKCKNRFTNNIIIIYSRNIISMHKVPTSSAYKTIK